MSGLPVQGPSDIWTNYILPILNAGTNSGAQNVSGDLTAGASSFTPSDTSQVSTPFGQGAGNGLTQGMNGDLFRTQLAQHTYGPADQALAALGIGTAPNAGQTDAYGNTFFPVVAGTWKGGPVDLSQFPSHSTGQNSQLWGGPTSDAAPDWLRKEVEDTLAMPDGPAKQARIQHIMDGITDPSHGANSHDVAFVEKAFGIIKNTGRPD